MISGSWLSAALDQLVPEEKKVRALISQKCSTKVEMMNLIILVPNIMNPDSPNNYPHCQDVSLYHETDRLKDVFVNFVVTADQHHFMMSPNHHQERSHIVTDCLVGDIHRIMK